ncbi:MAG: NusA antitermination factor [candidate division TM6 bacterium GW2011_GWF2_30_66]|nr:MAG: NusA antitermination factor [candidate division TM6 bacterium GW2011_GWF2_30_66]
MKLSGVIEELEKEKGLDRAILSSIICEGMLAAYQKKYPTLVFNIIHDKKLDEIAVQVQKKVVSSVVDEDLEVSVRKAKFINKDLKEGDLAWFDFDGKIGRIEVLRAKQVIAGKIRDIEAESVYNDFKDKVGTIVYGVIHKCEKNGILVKIQDVYAFLPNSLLSETDKCVVGFSIRALLKEVLLQPKNESQLILDRASSDFLLKLFELEVPEVFEKLVEVKGVARIPGYKSKIFVYSHDRNIDPVGACVGVGGARIKPILKELGGERIDVIVWGDSKEDRIRDSLKPAEVKRVSVVGDREANVWLDEDQRSIAIGKKGQNILLASKLTGFVINLIASEKSTASVQAKNEDDNNI